MISRIIVTDTSIAVEIKKLVQKISQFPKNYALQPGIECKYQMRCLVLS